ncbi:hypocretin neuropeptide precursor [Centroberyx affinis]|uniref:hypocretin neuropeptide precursor n=1 Tax=Centroberyx affinis TaxID=166261 RepID=UPI003A5BA3DE
MKWFSAKFQRDAGIQMSNRKLLLLVLMLLVSHLACDAHSVSECCRQSRSCRLYVLLCRSGPGASGGPFTGDAAAGILTLGKRKGEEHRFQSRLHQMLQGSKNQAAGILTMGKRTAEGAGEQYMSWSGAAFTTSLPV